MKFSVVMPINNSDCKFLYTTLPSVFRLEANEIILVFDKGSQVVETAKAIVKEAGLEKTVKLLEVSESPDWNFRIAYVRTMGFLAASNNIILNTDADTILDPRIKEYLSLIGQDSIALVSFRRLEFPLSLQFFVNRLLLSFQLEETFSPIYAFDKTSWLATEDFEFFKKIKASDDTHLHFELSKKYKALFKEVQCVHLKPVLTNERKYSEGKAIWQVKGNPFWKILARSIVYLDVYFLMGYIHERWSRGT